MNTQLTILKTKQARKAFAKKSTRNFIAVYLSHYLKSKSPAFHDIITDTIDFDSHKLLEIIGFRGSGKSFLVSLAKALKCGLYQEKRFIILISDTHLQAKQLISNLIFELENNELLRMDFGDMSAKKKEWTATSIELSVGVKILARSTGQQIRGLRFLQYRPDLLILDDIENIESVRVKEQRDKTEEWFWSDVYSANPDAQIIVIGNYLHIDSFVNRLKRKIVKDGIGKVLEFPLLDKNGNCAWSANFPKDKIEKMRLSNERFFQREYLLQTLSSDDQPIKTIKHYIELPEVQDIVQIGIGVDLAISQKQTADETSITVAGRGVDFPIYCIKNLAGRWSFNETLDYIAMIYKECMKSFPYASIQLGVEDIAFQRAAIEELERRFNLPVVPIKNTRDKKARMETIAPYFENGNILLPENGCEDLELQLLGLGIEAHDDRADSLEFAVRLLLEQNQSSIMWI